MYRAIQVKWLGPTNNRPTRFKAFTGDHSVTLSYDYDGDDNGRISAAKALATKLDWKGQWFGGCLPNGDYAFVCVRKAEKEPEFVVE